MEPHADILIIEDDHDLVNIMRIILESRHYQVREAYDGKQGYARIEEKMPDLIILDVMMSTETEGLTWPISCRIPPLTAKFPFSC